MSVAELIWITSRADVEQEIAEPLLQVVPDWEAQLAAGERLCALIDKHLDHEEGLRRQHFGASILDPDPWLIPNCLCREQKISLVTDLFAVAMARAALRACVMSV